MIDRRGWTLIELITVIGLMTVLLGLAAPPLVTWIRKERLEKSASELHETFRWAQLQAMKRGGFDTISSSGTLIKKRIYVALNAGDNSYQVVQWRDANNNGARDDGEFAELLPLRGYLGRGSASFGLIPSVNKAACSDTDSNSRDAIRPQNFMKCPDEVTVLQDHLCLRFDDKGFLSESAQNIGVFITNDIDSYAIALNPAGIITLCRWSGSQWDFIR